MFSYKDYLKFQTWLAVVTGTYTPDWNLVLYAALIGLVYGVIAGLIVGFIAYLSQLRNIRADPSGYLPIMIGVFMIGFWTGVVIFLGTTINVYTNHMYDII